MRSGTLCFKSGYQLSTVHFLTASAVWRCCSRGDTARHRIERACRLTSRCRNASKSSTDSSTALRMLLHRLHSMQPVSSSPKWSMSIRRSPHVPHFILAALLNYPHLLCSVMRLARPTLHRLLVCADSRHVVASERAISSSTRRSASSQSSMRKGRSSSRPAIFLSKNILRTLSISPRPPGTRRRWPALTAFSDL